MKSSTRLRKSVEYAIIINANINLRKCKLIFGIYYNRAFRAIQAGGNLFYRQVLGVVEEKDLFAYIRETLNRCAKVGSEFLTFEVLAGGGVRLGDTAFIYGVQGFDVVCFLLFSEVIDADVFGNPIQP